MAPELLFGLGILVVAAVAGWQLYARHRRREELALVARRLGLSYTADDTVGCLSYPFALLGRGDGRGTENVLSGTWQQIPLVAFDYWYYTESTDAQGHRSKTYHRFSCAVTEVDAALSHLVIERESLLTRLADAVGLDDIAFETEEFNRAFDVRSGDRKFANDLVDQRMMRWLLGTRGFGFETAGRWLLCYSKRRSPSELVELLGTLKGFRDQVPRVVYDLYPLGPRPERLAPPPAGPAPTPFSDGSS